MKANCFDIETGTFQALVTGTYFFSVNVEDGDGQALYLHLRRNGKVAASAFSPWGDQGSFGLTTILYLCKFDRVRVFATGPINENPDYKYTQFSGMLVDVAPAGTRCEPN